ncbi:hypothetical protein [Klebsiella pneumoniae]|uniref:hypothetical protein n=1 Tax=Klebsiella pneumoniae complex TaxID=3390273 RepID=UPI0021AED413|nr:hypothetical protein [Klebsiella pneumoniae]
MTSKLTRERLQEIAEDGFLKHGESKELARMALAAMDSEAKEPISFDEWSRKCALQITLCYPDFREKAQYIWDSARETQQPAPVVPKSISVRQAISALESAGAVTTIGQAYKMGWNACRAAMLAAAPQPQNAPQNIPEIIPNELIAAVNRLFDSNGSRGCYNAIKCYDAHIEVERLLAVARQEVNHG